MNIDDILKPYENEQPQVSMNSTSKQIERIPSIVNPVTGQVTDEFQEFYNKLVDAIVSNDVDKLYELSDKAMMLEEFKVIYNPLREELSKVIALPYSHKGIDIELNLQRFQEKHRNLIGGFLIITYILELTPYIGIKKNSLDFEQKYTEILFTYKCSKFVIISKFKPFVSVE